MADTINSDSVDNSKGNAIAGLFGGAIDVGMKYLQSRIDIQQTKEEAKAKQTELSGQAAASNSKTLYIVAGVGALIVVAFIVWRMFKK